MKRPNILFIFTDQQSATMLSCAGNRWLQTPAMDSIAARGRRFERAYCTNPVCIPSRFSLATGRYPSAIGLRWNDLGGVEVPISIRQSSVPRVMQAAGYETVYFGKQHLPNVSAEELGFSVLTEDERDGCAAEAAKYLRGRRERPFYAVASFINPHDICHMAIRDFWRADPAGFRDATLNWTPEAFARELAEVDGALERPAGVSEAEFFERHCPPLPANAAVALDEPAALRRMLEKRAFRAWTREHYTPERWREHRWAYARLTESVDRQIAVVLEALRAGGLEESTYVVFSSDHGDMDGAHGMEHKTSVYDESARVPLLIAGPGIVPAVDDQHLVVNGLDLPETFRAIAGGERPADWRGRNLLEAAQGRSEWRREAVIETEQGLCAVTHDLKYVRYDDGARREQLFDRRSDPGESVNCVERPENGGEIARLREVLDAHARKTFHPRLAAALAAQTGG